MSDIAPWDHEGFDEDAFNRKSAAMRAAYLKTPKGRAESLHVQLGLWQIENGGGTSMAVEREIARLERLASDEQEPKKNLLQRAAAKIGLILG